jgi:hypothetical protein
VILAAGVLALVVNLAPAQQRQGRGRGGMGGGVGQLLNMKEVQEELKLSDDHTEKAKKVAADVQMKHREDFQKLQDVPMEERRAKTQELAGQVREETLKDLGDVLKPEQTRRLKQLVLQQQANSGGPRVFLSPDVEKAVKLTDKQKDDLKTMAEDYGKKTQELRGQRGTPPSEESRKKREELRKEATDNALKVLTDEQKKQWEEMTGPAFKFPPPRRRGGGGGGR